MNHTIDTEDKKVEDPGPCRAVCRSGSPDILRTCRGAPVGDPADGAGTTRQSAGRKAEKKTKMSSRKPRKPRTASIVVCNLLTHRILAGRKGERKNENELQKAQKAQYRSL